MQLVEAAQAHPRLEAFCPDVGAGRNLPGLILLVQFEQREGAGGGFVLGGVPSGGVVFGDDLRDVLCGLGGGGGFLGLLTLLRGGVGEFCAYRRGCDARAVGVFELRLCLFGLARLHLTQERNAVNANHRAAFAAWHTDDAARDFFVGYFVVGATTRTINTHPLHRSGDEAGASAFGFRNMSPVYSTCFLREASDGCKLRSQTSKTGPCCRPKTPRIALSASTCCGASPCC